VLLELSRAVIGPQIKMRRAGGRVYRISHANSPGEARINSVNSLRLRTLSEVEGCLVKQSFLR
jgi:hypothetical protein